MKNFYKILITLQIIILLGVVGFGFFYQKNRVIDTTDYSNQKVYIDTDEYFKDEKTYRYIEEKIEFSQEIESMIAAMSNEEKVAQLFITTPEQLNDLNDIFAINAGETTKNNFSLYPVGGLVFSKDNIANITQIKTMLSNLSIYSNERINLDIFKILNIEDENVLYNLYGYQENIVPKEMNIENISEYSNKRSQVLKDLGYNMIFGPLANTTNSSYSYSEDSFDVLDCIETEIQSYANNNLNFASKYFPTSDFEDKSLDDMLIDDLYIFQGLIDDGVDKIIVSNKPCSTITNTDEICCLSSTTVDFIRARMGYDGMLISADLSEVEGENVAVTAIKSGMDMIYTSSDFKSMYKELLNAVNDGSISSVRLNNALGRILSAKLS